MLQVPLWSFLGWVTQIISRFDFQNPCYLDNLLLRLATTYSSAVIYPFQMAFGQFYDQNPEVIYHQKVDKIIETLQSPVVDRFIRVLKCLNLPEKVLEHFLCSTFSKRGQTHTVYEQKLKACYDDVFENRLRGKSTKKVEAYRSDFDELKKMNCECEYPLRGYECTMKGII